LILMGDWCDSRNHDDEAKGVMQFSKAEALAI
jgi:hypothetical protein